jgi:hypothetical protein
MCKLVLLDFVHRLNYKIIKLQRIESWILLSSSGRKGKEDRKPICWGPLVLLASGILGLILETIPFSSFLSNPDVLFSIKSSLRFSKGNIQFVSYKKKDNYFASCMYATVASLHRSYNNEYFPGKAKLLPFPRLSVQWNSENYGNAPIFIKTVSAVREIMFYYLVIGKIAVT